MKMFLEEPYFYEYLFSNDVCIVAFREAVNNSPSIQEQMLKTFLQSNNCSFYYLACLAYIASGCNKDKWSECLNKIFSQNVSEQFDDFASLVKLLNLKDIVISFLLKSNFPHIQKMKPFYLMNFNVNRNDIIKSIDFSMEVDELSDLFKKMNNIEKIKLRPEEVDEIYHYKALVLNLFDLDLFPSVIDTVKKHLPISLKGFSEKMIKLFYSNVFSQLTKEAQFDFLERHWNEDECPILLGCCSEDFISEFMNQSDC